MPDILTDKQQRSYNKTSRYADLFYYYNTIDEKFIYGTAKQLNKETPYKIHTVQEGESFDTLALYYYNNPTYYWIIADFNEIQDPYIELEIGRKIKIPNFSNIAFEN